MTTVQSPRPVEYARLPLGWVWRRLPGTHMRARRCQRFGGPAPRGTHGQCHCSMLCVPRSCPSGGNLKRSGHVRPFPIKAWLVLPDRHLWLHGISHQPQRLIPSNRLPFHRRSNPVLIYGRSNQHPDGHGYGSILRRSSSGSSRSEALEGSAQGIASDDRHQAEYPSQQRIIAE